MALGEDHAIPQLRTVDVRRAAGHATADRPGAHARRRAGHSPDAPSRDRSRGHRDAQGEGRGDEANEGPSDEAAGEADGAAGAAKDESAGAAGGESDPDYQGLVDRVRRGRQSAHHLPHGLLKLLADDPEESVPLSHVPLDVVGQPLAPIAGHERPQDPLEVRAELPDDGVRVEDAVDVARELLLGDLGVEAPQGGHDLGDRDLRAPRAQPLDLWALLPRRQAPAPHAGLLLRATRLVIDEAPPDLVLQLHAEVWLGYLRGLFR
mmetsp:Transcript_18162/g.52442  ORF Transcript_18162/g.52442 Transcript_18162/m.52442 type:complete len:264 (+) Transcript_18162:704-1495(+)